MILFSVLSISIVLIAIFSYTWHRFRASIYVHTTPNQKLIEQYPLPTQEVVLTTADGLRISSWYVPVKNAKAFIILLPGFTDTNGGRGLMLPHADYLYRAGYSTMLVDFRASGESQGDKAFLGVKEWQEAEAAYNYLRALPENKGRKIGFFGMSMGGATSIIAAGKTGKGDFVIASVPYASYGQLFADQIALERLPVWIFLPMLKLAAVIEFGRGYPALDPSRFVSRINVPLFVITGKHDTDVRYTQGEQLYELAHDPKEYWRADTGHDVHLEQPQEFEKRVLSFLERVIVK